MHCGPRAALLCRRFGELAAGEGESRPSQGSRADQAGGRDHFSEKEKVDNVAAVSAASAEAATTISKLQAVELELRKAQVRRCPVEPQAEDVDGLFEASA